MVTAAAMVTAVAMVTVVAMVSAAVMATVPILVRHLLSFSSPLMEPSVSFKTVTLFLSPPTRLLREAAPVSLSAMEL
jgi:hypothetical protein